MLAAGARMRRAFERGVRPFAAFVALVVAMAVAGFVGMPGTAAVLGLLAAVVMLAIVLAKRPPRVDPGPADGVARPPGGDDVRPRAG
jgi:hypothetical protein